MQQPSPPPVKLERVLNPTSGSTFTGGVLCPSTLLNRIRIETRAQSELRGMSLASETIRRTGVSRRWIGCEHLRGAFWFGARLPQIMTAPVRSRKNFASAPKREDRFGQRGHRGIRLRSKLRKRAQ